MRLDPTVNRIKFDREMRRLQESRGILESRGIFLLGSTAYPVIDLAFVPHHPLRAVVPLNRQGALFLPPGAQAAIEIPGLAATAYKAHFDLSDYDLDPPGLEFRDLSSDALLSYKTMFRA